MLKSPNPSHHQGLVHVVLPSRAAIVIFGVHGEAEEEDVHHILKHRQEAMGHEEGKHTNDEERQHPHGVVPLVIQSQNARKSCAWDYNNLRKETGIIDSTWPQQQNNRVFDHLVAAQPALQTLSTLCTGGEQHDIM